MTITTKIHEEYKELYPKHMQEMYFHLSQQGTNYDSLIVDDPYYGTQIIKLEHTVYGRVRSTPLWKAVNSR